MTRTTTRLARLVGGLMVATVVLAGCSDTADTSATGSSPTAEDAADQDAAHDHAEHNDADVAFAQEMIPHHEGAVMMAEVAMGRASDSRVVALAERIDAAQEPEIDLMTGWLQEWGQPLEDGSGHLGGMDHGSGVMDHGSGVMDHGSGVMDHGSGVMSHGSEDSGGMVMEDMPIAGPGFDRMWLEAMVEHHEGAVEMARTEVENGRDPEVIDLARLISRTQTQEIEEMEQLLTELGG